MKAKTIWITRDGKDEDYFLWDGKPRWDKSEGWLPANDDDRGGCNISYRIVEILLQRFLKGGPRSIAERTVSK